MTLYRQNQEESRRKSEFKAAHRKLPNVSNWETSKHQRPVQFVCLRAKKWTWFFWTGVLRWVKQRLYTEELNWWGQSDSPFPLEVIIY